MNFEFNNIEDLVEHMFYAIDDLDTEDLANGVFREIIEINGKSLDLRADRFGCYLYVFDEQKGGVTVMKRDSKESVIERVAEWLKVKEEVYLKKIRK